MADTNKMLQFKMGLHAGLAGATGKAGTVYITTDEKAMYVDVDDNKRIRIGDIIQVESARAVQPPFSTEALYYFIEENALLKWGPFGVDADGNPNGTNAWKQINSMSDLSEVEGRLDDLEDDFTTLNQQVNGAGEGDTGLVGRIETLEDEMDSAEERLIATEKVANDAKTAIGDDTSGLVRDVADLKDKDSDLEELIGDNTDAIRVLDATVNDEATGLVKKVGDLQNTTSGLRTDLGTTTDTASDTTTAFGRIKKLEDDLGTTNGNVTDVTDRVTTLEGNFDDLSDDVATNATDIKNLKEQVGEGTGLTGRITSLENSLTEEKGKITSLQGDMTTAKSDIAGLKEEDENLQTSIAQNASDITAVSRKVTALENVVGNASKGLVKDVADLKAADTSIRGDVTALTTRVGNIADKASTNETNIINLTNTVNDHDDAITTLTGTEEVTGSVKQQVKQVKDDLLLEIDKNINAANAMNYIRSVEEWADLPTTGVHVGDTYVVAATINHGGTTYYAGDLLVAVGTEDEETGVITSDLAWNHVKTGYSQQHDPVLAGANNKLTLTSLNGNGELGDLGIINFSAKANTSTTVEVANNTVTIGMAWGEF